MRLSEWQLELLLLDKLSQHALLYLILRSAALATSWQDSRYLSLERVCVWEIVCVCACACSIMMILSALAMH